MKTNEQGFTIAEIFVALVIFGIISVLAVTFLSLQSRTSGTAAKEMQSDEPISMTMKLIAQDIMHIQHGLSADTPAELAVYVTDERNKNDGAYHELYVNYGRFLNNYAASIPSVFTTFAFFKKEETGGGFTIPALDAESQKANLAHIGAAIVYNPTTLTRGVVRVTGVASITPFSSKFNFLDSLPSGYFAPATVYRFMPPDNCDCTGAARRKEGFLERNCPRRPNDSSCTQWDPNNPSNPKIVVGGIGPITIQDFRIRCLFVDDSDKVTLVWMPDNASGKTFNDMPARNLRLLEITIRYRQLDLTSDVRYEKSLEFIKNIRIGPRTTVFNRL